MSPLPRIFLSASVPDTADDSASAYLTQFAVRELVIAALGRRKLVWGGHPSITQLVRSVWKQFERMDDPPVELHLSDWFENEFTQADLAFKPNVVAKIPNDLSASLTRLREEMINQPFEWAVFVGGKDGLREEFEMYRRFHDNGPALVLSGPGGVAAQLPEGPNVVRANGLDFNHIYASTLGIDLTSERQFAADLTPPEPGRPRYR